MFAVANSLCFYWRCNPYRICSDSPSIRTFACPSLSTRIYSSSLLDRHIFLLSSRPMRAVYVFCISRLYAQVVGFDWQQSARCPDRLRLPSRLWAMYSGSFLSQGEAAGAWSSPYYPCSTEVKDLYILFTVCLHNKWTYLINYVYVHGPR